MAEKVKASKLTDDKVAARLARLAEEKASKALHITRQLDLEKIEVLSERIEKLLKSNNTLRNGTSKNEKDSHEIALYFKREMEIKDETIAKLNEEIIKRETQVKFEAEKIKRKHDEDLNELRFGTEHTTSELRMKLLATENDLSTLEAYRKGKDTYDETLVALEKLLKEESESKIIALEVQERTFFEEKAHIFKDLDRRKESLREIALKEARDAMGAEAMKISADNFRMYDELKFLHTMTAQIETEKTFLQQQLQSTTREVTILVEKELEYARQSHLKTKEIKILRDRVELLQKQQITSLDRFRQQAKELKVTVGKDLEEASVDSAGLRRLLKIKNQELRQMKALAGTILDQRSETEQFFMEALNEVKDAIRIERRQAVDEEMNLMRASGCRSAEIRVRSFSSTSTSSSSTLRLPILISKRNSVSRTDTRRPSRVTNPVEEKVRITDMSWSDKELVLRVLFAKLNDSNRKKSKVAVDAGRDTEVEIDEVQRAEAEGKSEGKGENYLGVSRDRDRDQDHNHEPPFFVSEGANDFLPSNLRGFQDSNAYNDIINDDEDDDDDDDDSENENFSHQFRATS